jgi:hypothetical protein
VDHSPETEGGSEAPETSPAVEPEPEPGGRPPWVKTTQERADSPGSQKGETRDDA